MHGLASTYTLLNDPLSIPNGQEKQVRRPILISDRKRWAVGRS